MYPRAEHERPHHRLVRLRVREAQAARKARPRPGRAGRATARARAARRRGRFRQAPGRGRVPAGSLGCVMSAAASTGRVPANFVCGCVGILLWAVVRLGCVSAAGRAQQCRQTLCAVVVFRQGASANLMYGSGRAPRVRDECCRCSSVY